MPCIVSTIFHALKICPMFMKAILHLKKNTFETLTIGHGLTLLQQMEYCNELQIHFFYLATICNLNCNSVDMTLISIQCKRGDYCDLPNPWILVTFPQFNGAKSFVTFLRPFLLLPQHKNPPKKNIILDMLCYNCRHMGCGNHMKMFVETYWSFYNFWNLSLLSSI